ncbi:GAF domain-containing protein [Candidatus Parcubacteria bacterium]|nr:MAG: GAF domain-containing protein [Candidatus Parcubacteria bacterium]
MGNRPIRILLIDAHAADVNKVKTALRQDGNYRITVVNQRAALSAYLATGEFDLVLMDVCLEDWKGVNILEAVRKRWPDIPVVVLTDQSQTNIALDIMSRGADMFVYKSTANIQQLPTIFAIILERKRCRNQRKNVEIELRHKNAELELLHDLNQAVNRGETLEQILTRLSVDYRRRFNCFGVTVYLLSDDRQQLIMQFPGMSSEQIELVERIIRRPIPKVRIPKRPHSWYWKVLESGQPAMTSDPEVIEAIMAELTENSTLKKLIPQIARALHITSVISAPLIVQGESVGLIDTSRQTPFGQDDLQRVERLAGEVSLLIKRQMTESQLKRRAAQQQTLNRIITAATRETDLQKLLETALGQVLQSFDLDTGAIWMNTWRAYRNLPPEFPAQITKAARDMALSISSPIAIADWENVQEQYTELAPLMRKFNIRASLTSSIVAGEEHIGGLSIAAATPRSWDQSEIDLAEAIGYQLGAVARRLQLLKEVTATRDYYKHILDALHDEILIIDHQYRIVDANEPFLRRMGYRLEEVVGKYCYQVSHQISVPCWQQSDSNHICPVLNVWKTGEAARSIHLHYDVKGQPIWLDLAASALQDSDGCSRWVIEAAREVTAEINLRTRLDAIYQLGQSLTLLRDESVIIKKVLATAIDLLDISMAACGLVDEQANELDYRYIAGMTAEQLRLPLDGGRGIGVAVARTGKTIYLPDTSTDSRYVGVGNWHAASAICVPMKVGERVIGVLDGEAEKVAAFSPQDQQLLQALADQAAMAVENARLYQQVQRQLDDLRALFQMSATLRDAVSAEEMYPIIVSQGAQALNMDGGVLLQWDDRASVFKAVAASGLLAHLKSVTIPGEGSISGYVRRTRRIYTFSDPDSADHIPADLRTMVEDVTSGVWAPIMTEGWFWGTLVLGSAQPQRFTAQDKHLLTSIATMAATAIQRSSLFESLQQSHQALTRAYDTTLEGWARALELRDQETEGHSRRVTEMTLIVAREMGIRGEQLLHIRRGALLHDIGKMGIPDNILLKPGKLNDAEWKVMRLHPVYARQFLQNIEYLRPALNIPYCHHERWDGSGYPRGLAGEAIPLEARIFSVVDVWDALTSPRPYRDAWPQERAKAYIQDQAGKMFDPQVVKVFLRLLDKGAFSSLANDDTSPGGAQQANDNAH